MTLNIFELDDLGIVPRIGEQEDMFLQSGNFIIDIARGMSNEDVVSQFLMCASNDKDARDYNFLSYLPDSTYETARRVALKYVKDNYGVNLSWVKFAIMIPRISTMSLRGGVCYTYKVGERQVLFPIIVIFTPSSTRHELIHAARFSLRSKSDSEFEEGVACNGYLDSSSWTLNSRKRVFVKIRKKLQEYFGDKHGYVFIRLSENELMNHIFPNYPPYGNPIRYLRVMGEQHLKYRIMCEELGLWKYDIV